MSAIFGSSSTTHSSQTSNQSGTNASNLAALPEYQDFLAGWYNQYSPANIAASGAVNPLQTTAGNTLTNAGNALAPATATSTDIAQNGLDPHSIAAYESPYTEQVTDAMQRSFDNTNANNYSQIAGNLYKQGAGKNVPNRMQAQSIYAANALPGQEAQLAQVRQQGFNTAAGLAQSSLGAKQQAANSLGSLSGVQTAIGTAQNQAGEVQRQAGLTPFNLEDQANSGTAKQALVAGNSYTAAGNSQGTSTTTQMGSPFGIGLNLLGLLAKDGGAIEMPNRADGGEVVPHYYDGGDIGWADYGGAAPSFMQGSDNYGAGGSFDWPAAPSGDMGGAASAGIGGDAARDAANGTTPEDTPWWKKMAGAAKKNPYKDQPMPTGDGGLGQSIASLNAAVAQGAAAHQPRYEGGGGVSDAHQRFADKVEHSFQRFEKMRNGGKPQGPGGPQQAGALPSFHGEETQGLWPGGTPEDLPDATATQVPPSRLGVDTTPPPPRAALAPERAPPSSGTSERPWLQRPLFDLFGAGKRTAAADKDTPIWDRGSGTVGPLNLLGMPNATKLALMSVANGAGTEGYANAFLKLDEARRAQALIDQKAQEALGSINGQPTIDARRLALEANLNPAKKAQIEAGSEAAQVRIKGVEQANTLYAQEINNIDTMQMFDVQKGATAEGMAYYNNLRAAAQAKLSARMLQLHAGSQESAPPSTPNPRSGAPVVPQPLKENWNPYLPNGGIQ